MMRTLLFLLLSSLAVLGYELPANSRQCVVGVAKDWDSSTVEISAYEKQGDRWVRVIGPWQGRLGSKGLVWGLGMSPRPSGAKIKAEGDGRSPAGVFSIGGAWGYEAQIKKNPKLFYHQVTSRDLWVEDVKSSQYNQHVVIDHEPATAWEKKQQMHQNDPAHALKLFIAHNAPPKAAPGHGSAIFFHIWRADGAKATAGCTTMAEKNLRKMIAWIDPAKAPVYVLLPASEYAARQQSWKLP
jgi:L,D-peptidoglycan transpeptidase YkuD (ErfK/YbiS/YcfS/YnhG family)